MNYTLTVIAIAVLVVGVGFMILKETSEPRDEQPISEERGGVADTTGSNAYSETPTDSGRVLDVSGQGLAQVPDSVFNRTDVEVLDVSNNQLDGALQAEVRHLRNLRVLDLSNNNFTGVPAEVGQLTKLEVLDLSNNPIAGLPHEIGNLRNLHVLDLRGTNYAKQDLDVIQQRLPSDVEVMVD